MTQTTRYAQVLAKIGAERSALLSEAKIKTLTESENLSEFVAQLRDTDYQEQIAKLPLPYTSRMLERAFHEDLIAATVKIIKNSPRRSANYLGLYIYKYEVENIKALIKATNAKLDREQKLLKMYFTAEDYLKNRAVIEEAAKADTMKQIVNAFNRTEYARALSMGQQSYEEGGFTTCFDVLMDKVFHEKVYGTYVGLSKTEKAKAHFYASMETDSFTLLTLLRGKNLNYDPNWLRLAVPPDSFKIYAETVEDMVTAVDFESALKIALNSYYARFFVKAQNPEETMANAEKAFKKAVLKHAKDSRVSENFNLGLPLSYLTQKETEVHNLTATSSGIEAAVNPAGIQTQLLL